MHYSFPLGLELAVGYVYLIVISNAMFRFVWKMYKSLIIYIVILLINYHFIDMNIIMESISIHMES